MTRLSDLLVILITWNFRIKCLIANLFINVDKLDLTTSTLHLVKNTQKWILLCSVKLGTSNLKETNNKNHSNTSNVQTRDEQQKINYIRHNAIRSTIIITLWKALWNYHSFIHLILSPITKWSTFKILGSFLMKKILLTLMKMYPFIKHWSIFPLTSHSVLKSSKRHF